MAAASSTAWNSTGRSAPPARTALDGSNRSSAATSSSTRRWELFITIDRRLGPGQWADLGGYVHALAFLARGYGLDTCPQVAWIRMYKIVGAFLKFPPEQMLFCGMGVGYGDRRHPVNCFRSSRAELHEFCKFYGFD